jgi:hypothetical protein
VCRSATFPVWAAADAARMPRLDAVRADAARGDWIDPRPTYMIVAARPQSAPT